MTRLQRILIYTGVAMVLTIAIFFLFRNTILHSISKRVSDKLVNKYGAELAIDNIGFNGLFNIEATGVSLITPKGDTLLNIGSTRLSTRLSALFLLRLRFDEISVDNVNVYLAKDTTGYNFSFLFRKKQIDTTIIAERNWAKLAKRLYRTVFSYVPDELKIANIAVNYTKQEVKVFQLSIPEISIADDILSTSFIAQDNNAWSIKGKIDRGDCTFDMMVFPTVKQNQLLPYIKDEYNAEVSFDTIHVSIDNNDLSNDVFSLNGQFSLAGLQIKHPKLATTDIKVNYAGIAYKFNVGKDYVALDSSSQAYVNTLSIKPYLYWQPKPLQTVALKVLMDNVPANDFFSSLPEGMFNSTRGIQADGNLTYKLNFKADLKNPDSLVFESSMTKRGFKIRKFGEENLTKMNGAFSYTAYEKGIPVKTFIVGPDNPDFTYSFATPMHLRYAILTSEDGSFFGHRGFNEDAFRQSIIENIKKERFARGGSTISMQLVKNVFLSRNKTVARKAEEALIVWLIENNGLCSKERMFEVYLNVIEWGPRIYGIKEAAQFYFAKKPADLNLAECIYLASIIPRPKAFMYSFDMLGNLRPDLESYYRVVSGIMLKKGLITQAEHDALQANVRLRGLAQYSLKGVYLTPEETSKEEDPEE